MKYISAMKINENKKNNAFVRISSELDCQREKYNGDFFHLFVFVFSF